MKANAHPRKKRAKYPGKSYRNVPFDEMRRLMRLYGSAKCFRKRTSPGDTDPNTDSVKRKFYRWFPDLDERFDKEEGTGRYVPKIGHEAEVRYRGEMRKKDEELLTKKRAKATMKRNAKKRAEEMKKKNTMHMKKRDEKAVKSWDVNAKGDVSPFSPTTISPYDLTLTFSSLATQEEQREAVPTSIQFEAVLGLKKGIADEDAPGDSSIAKERIFDDVEESFFGPSPFPGDAVAPQDRTTLATPSSCSSSSMENERGSSGSIGSSVSWEMDLAFINDMVDKTIEECCEEILGLEDEIVAASLPCWTTDGTSLLNQAYGLPQRARTQG